jgi:hypothetical protein
LFFLAFWLAFSALTWYTCVVELGVVPCLCSLLCVRLGFLVLGFFLLGRVRLLRRCCPWFLRGVGCRWAALVVSMRRCAAFSRVLLPCWCFLWPRGGSARVRLPSLGVRWLAFVRFALGLGGCWWLSLALLALRGLLPRAVSLGLVLALGGPSRSLWAVVAASFSGCPLALSLPFGLVSLGPLSCPLLWGGGGSVFWLPLRFSCRFFNFFPPFSGFFLDFSLLTWYNKRVKDKQIKAFNHESPCIYQPPHRPSQQNPK